MVATNEKLIDCGQRNRATENEFEVQKWIFFDCFEKKKKEEKRKKLIFMIMSSDV
jgi:hypothetical protein